MSITDLVTRHLADPQASWAIGTFGAIAEYHRHADEPVVLSAHDAVTAWGGIRLRLDGAVRAVAWECPSSDDSWTHGIALCLARDAGAMSGRTAITELGPDAGALREEDGDAILFDLGIGAPHGKRCSITRLKRPPENSRGAGKSLPRSGGWNRLLGLGLANTTQGWIEFPICPATARTQILEPTGTAVSWSSLRGDARGAAKIVS